MPSPIQNKWTLAKILQSTYRYRRNRFQYKLRDMVKIIRIEKVAVYDMKSPGAARTKFIVTTHSTPQYWPYYTKLDSKGRYHKRQYKYRHEYQVTLQLEELSLNVPFKMRVGGEGKWDVTPAGNARKVNGRVVEGKNYLRGLNGDFIFTCEWVWQNEGILFGRSYAKYPPVKTNPYKVVFLPKHAVALVEGLMKMGILKK